MPEHSSFHLDFFFFIIGQLENVCHDDELVPLLCTNFNFLAGGVHIFLSCWHFVVVDFLFENDAEPCAV